MSDLSIDNKKTKPPKKTLVDIAIPLHNDAKVVAASLPKLIDFLDSSFPYDYRVVLVENASHDDSWTVAQGLAKKYPKVTAAQLSLGGRGRAVKHAWSHGKGEILAYMDIDLSTDLSALEPMITPLVEGKFSVATGSRLKKDSKIDRRLNREIISRIYNYIIRSVLDLKTSDAQCGFKAIRADTAKELLPSISDNSWFFDSELLVKAERAGLVVHEVAVTWYEDPDSRVKILKTSVEDLRGIKRLHRELHPRSVLEKWAIRAIIIATAVAYIIGVTRNGYANGFYTAAVQAGTHSWKAFFFGSLDGSNFISVDKPPFFLWRMEIFTRVFGFHAWSMLLPSILSGVGSVALVYATVRRWFSAKSALLAAVVMATTPVAVMMFGYNNPDSLLTLLMVASIYGLLRAIEGHHPLIWLSFSGVLIGLGFNTKMLQALLIVPVIVGVYLYAGRGMFSKKLKLLLLAAIPSTIVALWWSVIVWLTPAASRPYIGSSGNNSIWSLIFGYNGVNRLTSGGDSSVSFGGSSGILRMFNASFGPGIAWLLAPAILGLILVIWLHRHEKRGDKTKVAALVFGGFLIINMVIFSLVGGVIHPYYAVVMAPAIAGLLGVSLPIMLREYKRSSAAAFVLPLSVAITGVIACILMGYSSHYLPWLRWLILDLSVLSAAGLLLNLVDPKANILSAALGIGLVAGLLGPLSYSLATISAGHNGPTPLVGPTGEIAQTTADFISPQQRTLSKYLLSHRGGAKWIVAVNTSSDQAPLQIAANQPVMALGGFDGMDSPISLSAFKLLVKTGQLDYYAISNPFVSGLSSGNNQIQNYVQAHGTKVNYFGAGYLLYRL